MTANICCGEVAVVVVGGGVDVMGGRGVRQCDEDEVSQHTYPSYTVQDSQVGCLVHRLVIVPSPTLC